VIKLKKTISHLDEGVYQKVEAALIKNKADNFLFLFRSYREDLIDDQKISETLELSSNSFYVLKSRLYDKIQEFLSGNLHSSKEEVTKLLHQIPEMCYGASREVATAFLEKLEKDLLYYDMHNELLVVYSALKKIHLYSEKYFHYSQLYNKHMAFSMSLEKAEELLGNFTRALGRYNFSRSSKMLEELQFLKKSIDDHFALSHSRQIEIIKNLAAVQLDLFCNIRSDDQSTEERLRFTEKIINELPESSPYKSWSQALDYLCFEYYKRIDEQKQTLHYFQKVESGFKTLLLSTNICLTSCYLVSRIEYLQQQNNTDNLIEDYKKTILFDEKDTHAEVLLGIYRAMICYYKGAYKEAASELNAILNINSFKDYIHINTEIKLALSFIYLALKEYALTENILKNIQRKIKAEKLENYANVLDLIKVFNYDIKSNGKRPDSKQKDQFLLFNSKNERESKILNYLVFELKKKYS